MYRVDEKNGRTFDFEHQRTVDDFSTTSAGNLNEYEQFCRELTAQEDYAVYTDENRLY